MTEGRGIIDERERLAAVRRYDILDTPPDGAFDRVTSLAARLCRVPISTVTIVDEDRIWFKSTYGVEVDQIAREPGLCASAIFRDAPHVVTDAIEDPRTLENSLVRGELGLRFYVGIPLRTADGYRLGTLNVIDREPRQATDEELGVLTDLAAVVVDELELRLAARRTVELQAAREAAEFRDTILSGISHGMRTPLAILHGLSSLEPPGAFDEDSRQVMRRQVRQLDWLVNQFIHFSSIEKGDPPLMQLSEIAVDRVVDEAVEIFVGRGDIVVDVPHDLPPVRADKDQACQIVMELLTNALRASPPGGTVLVSAGTRDGAVAISVEDDGPGIPPDLHERVFERFHHGRAGGQGIGLYVARALAQAQDGQLELDSDGQRGARFTLLLPAVGAAA